MYLGCDISFYQTDRSVEPNKYPDFARMKETGIGYVIIRAGQNTWVDTSFSHNWKSAKGILPRGSYWFYDSRIDPREQAKLWLSVIGNDYGELPMWCDFEDRYGGAFHGWKHWYTFISSLTIEVPESKIGIYTGFYYWKENTLGVNIPSNSLEWFKKFPLWIAQYKTTKVDIPKPWDDWTFWQFTDEGYGIYHGVQSEELDMNYYNGDQNQFNIRFDLSGGQPQPGSGMRIKLGE